jgi:hypothetical protein
MQTRLGSFVEAWTNVVIGYGIQCAASYIVLHGLGLPISIKTNFILGGWMTLVSLARSYLLRRFFNKLRLFTYAAREVREEEKEGLRQPKAQER